jgi:NADH dehydrogenase/NADH:ubiquinone oxidoreductase subunit G
MAFFDSLKETVTDLAQAGVAKSKQVAEITKLKAANMSEEDAIKKAYIELGKLYYAERGDAPEAAYISSCEKITTAKANIEANNAKIAELKETAEGESEVVVDITVERNDPASPAQEAAPEAPAPEQPADGNDGNDINLTL